MRFVLYFLTFVCVSGVCSVAEAQPTTIVQGIITDSDTGRPIPRGTVGISGTYKGVAADEEGFYQIEVQMSRELVYRALGYTARRKTVKTTSDTLRIDVALRRQDVELGSVVVEAEEDLGVPASYQLSGESLKNAPALGQTDVIRTVAFLPGISQPNDLRSSLTVRGGASDQNQYLLDGVEVYNPNHLLGVLGPFNAQVLDRVTLHAAEFPAQYGGRLSGVVAMETKRPPDTTFARVNVSLISAGGVLSRQIGDTGVTVSARRTYADPALAAAGSEFWYNFYDANLSVEHKLSPALSAEVLGFISRDSYAPRTTGDSESVGLDVNWGGRMAALRLNHTSKTFNQSLTGSFVRSYTDGRIETSPGSFYDNAFRTVRASYRAEWVGLSTRLDGGLSIRSEHVDHDWNEGPDAPSDEIYYDEAPPSFKSSDRRAILDGYADVERVFGPLTLQVGGRVATPVSASEPQVSPRVRLSADLSRSVRLHATAGRYLQYVAEGAEGREQTIDEPTFLIDEPQEARTYTVGTTVDAGTFEIGVEGYLRNLSNVQRLQADLEAAYPNFVSTEGRVRGVDVFVKRQTGRITGQISYSYTNSELTTATETYAPDWSTPHSVQGLTGVRLGSWQLRVAGTWRSGLPFTPVRSSFQAPVNRSSLLTERFVEGDRNSARLPAYSRLDASVRRTFQAERYRWTLYVQALNILNRSNPLRVDTETLYRSSRTGFGTDNSLPIVPSVGVEFEF